jgi:hypothetical protein
VKVTLKDGRAFSEKVDRPLGRTSDNPIPPGHMKAKFEDCAARVLPSKAVAAVVRMVDAFDKAGSVRELTALLDPGAGAGKARRAAESGVA